MTLSKDNATKIQNVFEFETTIKTMNMNDEFIKVLNQYDSIISGTNDSKTIKEVCKQVLSKYDGG